MLEIHTVTPFRILRAAAQVMRIAAKQEIAENRLQHRKVTKRSNGDSCQVTAAVRASQESSDLGAPWS